jgi:hypothetical protein
MAPASGLELPATGAPLVAGVPAAGARVEGSYAENDVQPETAKQTDATAKSAFLNSSSL